MARGHLEPIRRFSGVDLSKDPRDLSDDRFARAENVYEEKPGWVTTRKNTKLLTNVVVDTGADVVVLGSFNDQYGKHWLIFWQERRSSSGYRSRLGYIDVDAGTWTAISGADGPVQSFKPQFVEWDSKLMVFGAGGAAVVIFDPKADGTVSLDTSWMDDGEWATNPIVSYAAEQYRNSIALAVGARLHFMQMDHDTVDYNLLTEEKSLDIGNTGERIVGLKQIAVLGGSEFIEPYAMVFKERSVWVVRGDAPTQDTDGTLVVTPLMEDVGCVAKETIVTTPYGVVWCSGDNVYLAREGSKPLRIGDEIASLLSKLSKESRDGWHAAFYDGYYRLTVPSQSVGGDGATTEEGITPTEQWWLDLREIDKGEESRYAWWGPQLIPAAASHVETFKNGRQRLLNAFYNYEDATTRCHLVECDVEAENYLDAHWGMQGLQPMSSVIYFKEFDFGDPNIKKIIQSLEIEAAFIGTGIGAALNMIRDGGQETVLFPPNNIPLDQNFGLGEALGGSLGLTTRKYAYRSPDSERFVCYSVQPVFTVYPNTLPTPNKTGRMVLKSLGLTMRPISRRP